MRSKDQDLMRKIKSCVETYALEHSGRTPTQREIADTLGIAHTTVSRYLHTMNDLGMIRYEHRRISTDVLDKIDASPLEPHFVDSVPAGPADDLTDHVEEFVQIPAAFKGGMTGRFFIITVSGVSMVDAGIDPGDMVIVHQQQEAREGDIAVALVDGHGSTIKRVRQNDKGLYLWAENESWSDEERDYGMNFSVQGVAVKVVKDL